MKLNVKTFAAFIFSSFLMVSSFSSASADRLTRAVADWTGGMVTCEVAEQILEQELGYKLSLIHISEPTRPY